MNIMKGMESHWGGNTERRRLGKMMYYYLDVNLVILGKTKFDIGL